MFDLEDLQTFIEVADAGGVSAAARRLGVSKTVVSRRLARLEENLGAQLLARSTRGVALTEAGLNFQEHARKISAELDAARETIHPNGNLRGRLRITVPLSFGTTHLAPVLAELARRHPQLHIHASYSDGYVDLIGEGFDAAIRVGYLADSSLVARKIRTVRAHVVASPDYLARHGAPKTPGDLLNHEVLLQGSGGGRPASVSEAWRFVDGDKPIVVRPHGRFSASEDICITRPVGYQAAVSGEYREVHDCRHAVARRRNDRSAMDPHEGVGHDDEGCIPLSERGNCALDLSIATDTSDNRLQHHRLCGSFERIQEISSITWRSVRVERAGSAFLHRALSRISA
jgi:DNA-binding transcriptional LysR family regulator